MVFPGTLGQCLTQTTPADHRTTAIRYVPRAQRGLLPSLLAGVRGWIRHEDEDQLFIVVNLAGTAPLVIDLGM